MFSRAAAVCHQSSSSSVTWNCVWPQVTWLMTYSSRLMNSGECPMWKGVCAIRSSAVGRRDIGVSLKINITGFIVWDCLVVQECCCFMLGLMAGWLSPSDARRQKPKVERVSISSGGCFHFRVPETVKKDKRNAEPQSYFLKNWLMIAALATPHTTLWRKKKSFGRPLKMMEKSVGAAQKSTQTSFFPVFRPSGCFADKNATKTEQRQTHNTAIPALNHWPQAGTSPPLTPCQRQRTGKRRFARRWPPRPPAWRSVGPYLKRQTDRERRARSKKKTKKTSITSQPFTMSVKAHFHQMQLLHNGGCQAFKGTTSLRRHFCLRVCKAFTDGYLRHSWLKKKIEFYFILSGGRWCAIHA